MLADQLLQPDAVGAGLRTAGDDVAQRQHQAASRREEAFAHLGADGGIRKLQQGAIFDGK